MKLTRLLLAFILITSYTSVQAQKVTNIRFKSDKILTSEGLFFNGIKGIDYQFGQRITPHGDCIDVINGYVFVTWYKGGMTKRNLMVSRKKVDGGEWMTIEFPDKHIGYQGIASRGDSHNTAAITICPLDSTIHLLYDMHAYTIASFPDNYFNYRVSKKGMAFVDDNDWNISLFNNKQNFLLEGVNYEGSTYPGFNRFDNGNIMTDIRFGGSGNGRDQYAIYDGKTWSPNVQFNNGNQPILKDKYSIYGSYQYANGKLYNGFSIRYSLANTDGNFKYVYNNGLFFAYATAPYSSSNWKDINGKAIAIPIQNPDVVKVAEPCEIGLGNYISISPLFTVTAQGDIHYMTTVSGIPVHYYKKASATNFAWSIDCPPTAGDMFSIGNTVLLVVLEDERPAFKVTKGGENNWTTLLKVTNGDRYRHCNVVMEGNSIFIYAMKVGTGDAQPITLLTYDMTLEQDTVIDNTAVKNVHASQKLSTFPNPCSTGIFKLNNSENWEVYSSLGQKMIAGNTPTINLSAYDKGMYLLKTKSSFDKLVSK